MNTPTINYITQVLEETVDHITQHGVTQSCPPLSVYSNMAIDNVRDIVRPLDILKEKLSRENIIKQQKIELKDIYMKTFASENFEYFDKENGQKFQLILDLLLIHFENDFKVYVPPSLVGPLLSYVHLLGHQGVVKMLKNLDSYYFPTKYIKVRKFISCCYACFLMHGSSRKQKIGNYPIPNYPMQEVSVDLAEGLNTVNGHKIGRAHV